MKERPLSNDAAELTGLRLELSPFLAKEERSLRREIMSAHTDFMITYGKYIKNPMGHEEMANRYLFTDQEGGETFEAEWFANIPHFTHEGSSNEMTLVTVPRMFTFGSPQMNGWDNVLDENSQKMTQRELSDIPKSQVINSFNTAYRYSEFSHEISHFYQNPKCPSLFSEAGAIYYGHQQTVKNRGYDFSSPLNHMPQIFYAILVDQYGEDVHRLFFGAQLSADKRNRILREWTPGLESVLFPDKKVVFRGPQR